MAEVQTTLRPWDGREWFFKRPPGFQSLSSTEAEVLTLKWCKEVGMEPPPHYVDVTTLQTKSAWELAGQIDVQREGPITIFSDTPCYPMGQLEDGIKFFVLALEELGAVTEYSCEGHPHGAYVSFKAQARLAKQIHMTSTFYLLADVGDKRPTEMCDCAMYAIRPGPLVSSFHYTEQTRVRFLRESADTWLRMFAGRLDNLQNQINVLSTAGVKT